MKRLRAGEKIILPRYVPSHRGCVKSSKLGFCSQPLGFRRRKVTCFVEYNDINTLCVFSRVQRTRFCESQFLTHQVKNWVSRSVTIIVTHGLLPVQKAFRQTLGCERPLNQPRAWARNPISIQKIQNPFLRKRWLKREAFSHATAVKVKVQNPNCFS